MIYTPTADVAEAADDGTALLYHLIYSHDPSLPVDLVPVAEEAIALARRGAWEAAVAVPDGYGFDDGATVAQLVQVLRLEGYTRGEES
jgi:hypothetical protein